MSNDKLVKRDFCNLIALSDQGFATWVTDALKLVSEYRLDVNDVQETFRIKCKHAVRSNYIEKWFAKLQDIQSNPILRTYKTQIRIFDGTISVSNKKNSISSFNCKITM